MLFTKSGNPRHHFLGSIQMHQLCELPLVASVYGKHSATPKSPFRAEHYKVTLKGKFLVAIKQEARVSHAPQFPVHLNHISQSH